MTDKSPADYLNYVTIKVNENESATLQDSQLCHDTEGTEQEGAAVGAIRHGSTEQVIHVDQSNGGDTDR